MVRTIDWCYAPYACLLAVPPDDPTPTTNAITCDRYNTMVLTPAMACVTMIQVDELAAVLDNEVPRTSSRADVAAGGGLAYNPVVRNVWSRTSGSSACIRGCFDKRGTIYQTMMSV